MLNSLPKLGGSCMKRLITLALLAIVACPFALAAPKENAPKLDSTAKAEHDMIGAGKEEAATHTLNPDAQWYPDAGFGLFIHWGVSSVKAMNISWPMIPGRALAAKKIDDPAERERIVREGDWNLNGKPNSITPNQYWEMAKDFNPQKYDPDKWLQAAKEAGFTYAVLTARHHEGFALWPSKTGDFNTSNFMGGRDLIKDYVEACRRNGLKVGIYYSPPDWHFDRDYFTFLYHGAYKNNPWLPSLDADLKPRTSEHSEEAIKKHQVEYAAHVNGQIEELLTRYGKIDLLWFDGKPSVGGNPVISQERIRELQPGIIINPRLHGHGDYVTFERNLTASKPVSGWAEFCNTWTNAWPHTNEPFRSNGFVLGQLAQSRALGVNYLLGVGPMSSGEFCEDIYKNMAIVAEWMKHNGESVHAVRPLTNGETSSVPAVAHESARYLFAIPKFKGEGKYDQDMLPTSDETLTLKGIASKPASVKLLGDGSELKFEYSAGALSVELPA
ncbi:MAG TPA: alpha-L-fucosidase, partial [Tepidisphaeraceae bacterium]|nr:alpha-L-fucosidase [Tepidisphaeraceae bacterium]